MKSPEPIQIVDFRKFWLNSKRGWWPTLGVLMLILVAGAIAPSKQSTFVAEGRLLLKKSSVPSGLLSDADDAPDDSEAHREPPLSIEAELEVLRSTSLIQAAIATLNLRDTQGNPETVDSVRERLMLQRLKGTDVINVSFESDDPKEAATVVNTLMNLYIQNNLRTHRAEALANRELINRKLLKTDIARRQAEAELHRFQQEKLPEDTTSSLQTAQTLDHTITQIQAQIEGHLAHAEALERTLNSTSSSTSQHAPSRTTPSQSPEVNRLLTELRQVQDDLAIQQTRYRANHPSIVRLKQQESALNQQLQTHLAQVFGRRSPISPGQLQISDLKQQLTADWEKAEMERQALQNQLQSLSHLRSANGERSHSLPELQQEQDILERQLEAAQATHQLLLMNLQVTQMIEQQAIDYAQIMAYAVPPEQPASSHTGWMVAAGLAIVGLLYLGTASASDIRDSSITTARDVRQVLNYTLLGMIPSWQKRAPLPGKHLNQPVPPLPVRDHPESVSSEMYRMLRANLSFVSPDQVLNVIVVTSPVDQEGKSTVSANLALAIAQAGQRVLLVDADMRHPMQHHIWDTTNTPGLSELIASVVKPEAALQAVADNLHLLPSGVIPPNPLELLNSQLLADLVQQFAQTFDLVLIDAPPLIRTSDALILGNLADGLLLVTRPGVVDSVSIAVAEERLRQSEQNVLGLVVNGIIPENEPDSYFHPVHSYRPETMDTPTQNLYVV